MQVENRDAVHIDFYKIKQVSFYVQGCLDFHSQCIKCFSELNCVLQKLAAVVLPGINGESHRKFVGCLLIVSSPRSSSDLSTSLILNHLSFKNPLKIART